MMADGKTLEELVAERDSAPFVVSGITVEGVTPETLNDFEFLETIAVMGDPDAGDNEKLRAIANIAPVIFGSRQWKRIKAELREQNDGKLPNEVVMSFIEETLAALNAKNC